MRKLLLAFIIFGLQIDLVNALPAQVIIIRHGEKNAFGQLTPKGQTRVEALASYLTIIDGSTTNPPLFNVGPPSVLFAARPVQFSDDNTVRCIQSLIPTALKLQLPVHSPYGPHQETQIAQLVLNDPRYNGKSVLICWHHTFIADLIRAFGYIPFSGIVPTYPVRYDLVWLLPFPVPSPTPTIQPILQELLFGDPTTFP